MPFDIRPVPGCNCILLADAGMMHGRVTIHTPTAKPEALTDAEYALAKQMAALPDAIAALQAVDLFLKTELEEMGNAPIGSRTYAAKLRAVDLVRDALVKATSGEREPSEVETRPFCVMSTAHIAENEASALDDCLYAKDYPIAGGPYGSVGWFFWVPTDPKAIEAEARAAWPSLHAAFDWCRARGFDYVLLDCDAERVESLPTYEW